MVFLVTRRAGLTVFGWVAEEAVDIAPHQIARASQPQSTVKSYLPLGANRNQIIYGNKGAAKLLC